MIGRRNALFILSISSEYIFVLNVVNLIFPFLHRMECCKLNSLSQFLQIWSISLRILSFFSSFSNASVRSLANFQSYVKLFLQKVHNVTFELKLVYFSSYTKNMVWWYDNKTQFQRGFRVSICISTEHISPLKYHSTSLLVRRRNELILQKLSPFKKKIH